MSHNNVEPTTALGIRPMADLTVIKLVIQGLIRRPDERVTRLSLTVSNECTIKANIDADQAVLITINIPKQGICETLRCTKAPEGQPIDLNSCIQDDGLERLTKVLQSVGIS